MWSRRSSVGCGRTPRKREAGACSRIVQPVRHRGWVLGTIKVGLQKKSIAIPMATNLYQPHLWRAVETIERLIYRIKM